MNLTEYLQASEICTTIEDEDALLLAYLEDNSSIEKRNAMLAEISGIVQGITTKIVEDKLLDTVISVKDYCAAQKVSRQYVNQEIKNGKFKTIELPIFTEYKGRKVAVGTQKFLSL
jgi:hypothetical protein